MRRPLLMGGVSLSVGLWLLDWIHHSLLEVGGVAVLTAIATGTGVWLWQRQKNSVVPASIAPQLTRELVEQALTRVTAVVNTLTAELELLPTASRPDFNPLVLALRNRLTALTTDCDRTTIGIAVMGSKGSGKSTLISLLASPQTFASPRRLVLQEIPASITQGNGDQPLIGNFVADLTLFLTTGDLTASEHRVLQELVATHQRVLLVLNKCDQYLPNDRPLLIDRLQHYIVQLAQQQPTATPYPLPVPQAEDVIAIAAKPNPLKVRRYQPDGSIDEWLETPTPDLHGLTQRLQALLTQDNNLLVWATVVRSALALHQEAQTALNQVRRDRALPLLDNYQWIAAAAAFANPVPALDLLATGAITAQLVLDLSAIYQQHLSLQQAQVVATTLASLLVKLGLVELSTQLLGNLLKSNAATFVVGGLLQGASAAYLTRLAGLSLMDYFQDQSLVVNLRAENPLTIAALSQRLQAVFQQNRHVAVLQTILQTAASRLSPVQSTTPA
ncbi:MAG: DUF697 domain-containing protein [Cyanobacteria bacterium]|nr:DUF697 domain-containing protein [Cyanobacteriota bacterium]